MGQLEDLRLLNKKRVVDVLRRRAFASRSELLEATGLSRTTVAGIVGELIAGGVAVERPHVWPGQSGRGRPPSAISLNAAAGVAIGVDFGHERLRVAIADLSSTILAERSADLDVDHEPVAAIELAASFIGEVLSEAKVTAVQLVGAAVGLPAPVDASSGGVSSGVLPQRWAGIDVGGEFAQRLGLPVQIDNDANLAALGEASFGAGRGFADLVYVMVSSGIGAGLILDGRLHRGATGGAGELGHVRLADGLELCRCGQRGCLETVASTGAVLSLLRHLHGSDLTLERVFELAGAGDVGCNRVLKDVGRALGRVLADVCSNLDPGAIIVGGELSAAGAPILEGIRSALDRYALPTISGSVDVKAGLLGDRATLIGAIGLIAADTERIHSSDLPALTWAG